MKAGAVRCVLGAAALVAVSGCESPTGPGGKPEPLKALPRELSAAERGLIEGSNRFAFGLLREVDRADTASNIFISPLSASMALGMTTNGARGATLEEMRATLGFERISLNEMNASYRSLINLLRGLDPGVEMLIGNSIWARRDFPVEPAFLQTGRSYFDAEVATLDFADPGAAATINNWVSRSTRGRIKTIVGERIPGNVVMYLINAIYFKGSWTQQFDPRRTRDAPFTGADGSRRTVKMMHRRGSVRHLSTPLFEAVDLPYGRGAFSMTVLLPARGTDLDALVARLDAGEWQRWMGQFAEREVEVALPRFRIEYEKQLDAALQALGMRRAFRAGEADFTGLSPLGHGLWVSEVKQKTYVDVNEQGTEAVAVTSVTVVESLPPSFVVDRPFLVVIRERFSGSILFIGKITAP
ncbi:MAG TPA: serpin family protein [Longimicrobiaceae bacterium]|nr:serpin family protein [Longimicrobiaceae bacterium]